MLKTIDDESWKNNFDKFLESISNIRSISKDTYLALTNNPIRTDIQIKKAEEELLNLQTILKEITGDIEFIKESSQKADGLIEKLEAVTTTIEEHSKRAEEILEKFNDSLEELNENNEQSNKMMTEISKIKESSKDLSVYLIEAKTNIDVLSKKSELVAANIEKNQTTLNDQIKKDKELQFEIEQTLQDVNKHGMAGAFKKRKDELKWTVIIWGTLSVISISVLVGLTYNFAKDIFDSQAFDPIKNLFKLPSAIAGVWLCWFCGKQFGYSMRIREDYSFKYAISMAFEGYKNETREINEDLLEKLLQMTIGNISINPTSIYDSKSNHGSPWHEFAAGIRSFFKVDAKIEAKIDTNDIPKN